MGKESSPVRTGLLAVNLVVLSSLLVMILLIESLRDGSSASGMFALVLAPFIIGIYALLIPLGAVDIKALLRLARSTGRPSPFELVYGVVLAAGGLAGLYAFSQFADVLIISLF